ncbi:MAG: FixH family protein, partial [Acetobacteraceae bacterium]|nr:FixH family protein [Acetobacteraceae bacterium]
MSDAAIPTRRSAWIPWVFVGGMLLVVAVNAVLVFAAISTFTGLTVSGAYDRGRTYNQVLAEAARQDALGWRTELVVEGGLLRVAVTDREGLPVPGRLDGVLRAPLEGIELPLQPIAIAPGRWQATLEAPRAGQWEARLTLTGAAGGVIDIRRRVVL